MDATALPPDAPLPDDVVTLQEMVRTLLTEVARLRAENDELRGKLDAALKHRFGRRSERRKPPPASPADRPARRRHLHGRAALPEDLERRDVVHDLTEAERLCPCCGRPRAYIGSQPAEQLDLEPARFFVLRTVKRSYACRHCNPAAVPGSSPRSGSAQITITRTVEVILWSLMPSHPIAPSNHARGVLHGPTRLERDPAYCPRPQTCKNWR
jgi:hypothetical protein